MKNKILIYISFALLLVLLCGLTAYNLSLENKREAEHQAKIETFGKYYEQTETLKLIPHNALYIRSIEATDKIKDGMTVGEVTKLIGHPNFSLTSGTIMYWEVDDKNFGLKIEIDNHLQPSKDADTVKKITTNSKSYR